jgi:hypothetical protein
VAAFALRFRWALREWQPTTAFEEMGSHGTRFVLGFVVRVVRGNNFGQQLWYNDAEALPESFLIGALKRSQN